MVRIVGGKARARTCARVLLALCFLACGASANAREPVRSLLEIRQANVVPQIWDISCGAASLATLLTYQHDHPVSERYVAETMLGRTDPLRVRVRGGFSLLDLKRFAEGQGFIADGYIGITLEDLVRFGPAIIPVVFEGFPHFVVFRGKHDGRVLLADPAFGNRTVDLEEFERGWWKVAFVVSRPDGQAPPSRLGPQLQDITRPPPDMIRTAIR
jgi:uncharacterized protein